MKWYKLGDIEGVYESGFINISLKDNMLMYPFRYQPNHQSTCPDCGFRSDAHGRYGDRGYKVCPGDTIEDGVVVRALHNCFYGYGAIK